MKQIALLGSTGSIGQNVLRVAAHLPEQIEVVALAASQNIALLEEQIALFHPKVVAVYDHQKAQELSLRLKGSATRIVAGVEGLSEIASLAEVNFVVMAITGLGALAPTLAAIDAGKDIALASKEVLAAAGEFVMQRVREKGISLIPIDSEHSAIFQCLDKADISTVHRLILTASGGPFRTLPRERLQAISVKEALNHPTWSMGSKVTIDSSTLMNKGLEMIEARWLFDIPHDKIEIVVHPQSIVHSFVEFIDGSMLAQMSEPHMLFPIQYALTYPQRSPGILPKFDFTKNARLEFYKHDSENFPAIDLAYEAMSLGGSAPCCLNGANEVLVYRFLQQEISWLDIIGHLEKLLTAHRVFQPTSIEDLIEVDREARVNAAKI